MTHVLVVYDTTDGHTRRVAQAISRHLSLSGADVDVMRAGRDASLVTQYDGIIVAGSVHAGAYQKRLRRWVAAHRREFAGRPTAFVSVSLAVLQQDAKAAADLDAVVDRFCTETGWRPDAVKQVAGALLYTRYNVFKRWIMKRIVAKAGGATDTSRDYEYTDWDDLGRFADEFRRRLVAAAA